MRAIHTFISSLDLKLDRNKRSTSFGMITNELRERHQNNLFFLVLFIRYWSTERESSGKSQARNPSTRDGITLLRKVIRQRVPKRLENVIEYERSRARKDIQPFRMEHQISQNQSAIYVLGSKFHQLSSTLMLLRFVWEHNDKKWWRTTAQESPTSSPTTLFRFLNTPSAVVTLHLARDQETFILKAPFAFRTLPYFSSTTKKLYRSNKVSKLGKSWSGKKKIVGGILDMILMMETVFDINSMTRKNSFLVSECTLPKSNSDGIQSVSSLNFESILMFHCVWETESWAS